MFVHESVCERLYAYICVYPCACVSVCVCVCVYVCACVSVCVLACTYLTTFASRCAVPLPSPTTKSWGPRTAPGVRDGHRGVARDREGRVRRRKRSSGMEKQELGKRRAG